MRNSEQFSTTKSYRSFLSELAELMLNWSCQGQKASAEKGLQSCFKVLQKLAGRRCKHFHAHARIIINFDVYDA